MARPPQTRGSDKARQSKERKERERETRELEREKKNTRRQLRETSIESTISKIANRSRPKTHPYSTRTSRSRSKTPGGPSRKEDLFDIEANSTTSLPPVSATDGEGDSDMNNDDRDSPTEEEEESAVEDELQTPRAPRVASALAPAPSPRKSPTPSNGNPETSPDKTMDQVVIEPAPAPAHAPMSQDHPIRPEASAKNKEQTEDDIKAIKIALKEAAEAATIGGWVVPQIPFNLESQDEPKSSEKTKPPKKEWIQWIPIKAEGLPKELLHHSGNNLDFMAEKTINECAKAAKNKPNDLGDALIPLVYPGFKLLFHVVCFGVDLSGQIAWTMHAIRSVLDVAKINFSNALAIVPVSKPGYNWILVSFTKLAYDALTGIRGLLDPRARALVLIREWSMIPPSEQTLSFSGLLSYSDKNDVINDALKSLKEQLLDKRLEECGVKIMDVKQGRSPKNAPQLKLINVHLKFDKDAKTFVIPPSYWNRKWIRTAKGTRKLSVRYGPRCATCSSESHTYAERCPWLDYKVNSMTMNVSAPALNKPGDEATPKPEKRKHVETEKIKDELPSLIDVRPKKYRKVEKRLDKEGEEVEQVVERTEVMAVE